MHNKLSIGPAPHISDKSSTARIMGDVLLALSPALVASAVIFGPQALLVTAVCAASCAGAEYLCRKIMGRPNTLSDLSAVVTGVLLAFCLPVSIPLWMAALGSVFAIAAAKQVFGGLGCNFVNPALAGRVFLMISFPSQMTDWTGRVGAVSEATPLAALKDPLFGGGQGASLLDLFLGKHGGSLGEVCAAALLLGAAYLFVRRVIRPAIPLSFLGAFALITALAGAPVLEHLLTGGLLLGAFFMATDYVTSPFSTGGKLIFGAGAGILTALFRLYGAMPEGVSYAILLMNLVTPLLNRMQPHAREAAK